jgi:hypothetical protein
MAEAAVTQEVVANANPLVQLKEFTFRFKKDKLGNKRANVKCESVPTPSAQGIVAILKAGGKQLELLEEICADTVRSVLSDFVSDENFNPESFDFKQVSWEAIANMPKEDRRSSSIAKEVWEAFAADYIEIMPALTAKSLEQVTLATEIYVKKMAPIKTQKGALNKLKDQLTLYVDKSQKAEEFMEIIELLNRRIETYLKADDPQLLAQNL